MLTMLSVAIAFWLYGTLDGVTAAFDDALDSMTDAAAHAHAKPHQRSGRPAARASRADRERARRARRRRVERSSAATIRTPSNCIEVAAIDIRRVCTRWRASTLDDEQRRSDAARAHGRDHRPRARRQLYGWKIGDRVTVQSPVWAARPTARTTGRSTSSASTAYPEGAFPADEQLLDQLRLLRRGARVREGHGHVLHAASSTTPIAPRRSAPRSIALFANSADETLTQSEQDFFGAQIERVGNIGFIVELDHRRRAVRAVVRHRQHDDAVDPRARAGARGAEDLRLQQLGREPCSCSPKSRCCA